MTSQFVRREQLNLWQRFGYESDSQHLCRHFKQQLFLSPTKPPAEREHSDRASLPSSAPAPSHSGCSCRDFILTQTVRNINHKEVQHKELNKQIACLASFLSSFLLSLSLSVYNPSRHIYTLAVELFFHCLDNPIQSKQILQGTKYKVKPAISSQFRKQLKPNL